MVRKYLFRHGEERAAGNVRPRQQLLHVRRPRVVNILAENLRQYSDEAAGENHERGLPKHHQEVMPT